MPERLYSLTWTSPALQDLLEITQYIKDDNPEAARRFGKQVKEKVSRLARFPRSGRIVPEFSVHGLREVIAGDYRIIYRVVSAKPQVEILTVRHGARLLKSQDQ